VNIFLALLILHYSLLSTTPLSAPSYFQLYT